MAVQIGASFAPVSPERINHDAKLDSLDKLLIDLLLCHKPPVRRNFKFNSEKLPSMLNEIKQHAKRGGQASC